MPPPHLKLWPGLSVKASQLSVDNIPSSRLSAHCPEPRSIWGGVFPLPPFPVRHFLHISWVIFLCVNLPNFSLSQICLTESTAENSGERHSCFFPTFSSIAFYYGGDRKWGGQSLVVRIFWSTQKSWVCSIKHVTNNLSSRSKSHSLNLSRIRRV